MTIRPRGVCHSCEEVTEVHSTEEHGEWLCLTCKEQVYPPKTSLAINKKNGKTYLTGLGL
jgi:hypothetical protein